MNRAMKLFAVVALTGGTAFAQTPRVLKTERPAAGNTMTKKKSASPKPEEAKRTAEKPRTVQARTLKNGRPAAGNTESKR